MQGVQVLSFSRSTIGKKVIMAVTGVIGIGFILVHMYGNLKVFIGPEYFNAYSEDLRALGAPIFGHAHALWIMRLILIASVALHVWAATALTIQARKARPDQYAVKRTLEANYASKLMRWGGVVIFVFILYHLMHFTWGNIHPDFIPGEVYHNLVVGFQFLPNVIFYLIAVSLLGLHLYHGGWSMMQTLGILSPRYDQAVRRGAAAFALLMTLGFAVVPLAVLFGVVK